MSEGMFSDSGTYVAHLNLFFLSISAGNRTHNSKEEYFLQQQGNIMMSKEHKTKSDETEINSMIYIICNFMYDGAVTMQLFVDGECPKISNILFHYENTPIQIYRKFLLQKLKIFR